MNRRNFIVTGILGGAAAITGLCFASWTFETAAAGLITKHLPFLTIDKKGLQQFVKDFSQRKNASYRIAIKGYSLLNLGPERSGKIELLISTFLLSTDFFQNGAREDSIVRYVGLYDPHSRPCNHPFAHYDRT
jgi:hypothetical protein